MLFPNVKILECRRERLHNQFIARSEVFVEAAHRNTGLLHHIGDADPVKSALAKPLGSHPYNPLMCRLLVPLGMPHTGSSSTLYVSSRNWRHGRINRSLLFFLAAGGV